MRAKIFKSHRFLAKLLAFPMLLWALSGLMHPFMANWFKPEIAHKHLPVVQLPADDGWQEPATVLRNAGVEQLQQLHTIKVDGRWLYQVVLADKQNRYFDARSGMPVSDAESRFVAERAAAHAGLPLSAVTAVEKVESFDETYRFINRYLPVYRVSLDTPNALQVYIDPLTQKMAAFSTQWTRAYRVFFAYAHNWSFLGDASDPLRVTAVLLVVTLITWVGLAGLSTYWGSRRMPDGRRPQRPLHKRLHRSVGLLTSVLFLMLAASGVLHTLTKYQFDWGFLDSRHSIIETRQLTAPLLPQLTQGGATQLSLASIEGRAAYRLAEPTVASPGATRYIDAKQGTLIKDGDARYARELGAHFTGVQPSEVGPSRLLTEFGKTYPVIQKRLPVRQMKVKVGPYMGVAVDTAHGHLATRIKPIGLAETVVFLNLHKFHFVDGLSKELRDWLSVVASGLMILTLGLGINLAMRRRMLARSVA